jgi:nucleotide-binding universal stress UspA family protein
VSGAAWGFTEDGELLLLSVMLGMRESHEDWLELGRDPIARGLGAPLLIVADGAPGLIKTVEQSWPASDRQHCAVHRVRNLLARLPERERESVRLAYWQALDEAINERNGKQRLEALIDELDSAGYTAAAKCLADDLDALVVHLRYPTRHRRRWRSTNQGLRRRSGGGGALLLGRRHRLLGAFGTSVSHNLVLGNQPSGDSFVSGGIAVVQGAGGTDPQNDVVSHNKASDNVPNDLFWDGRGTVAFEKNHCATSDPAGLCTGGGGAQDQHRVGRHRP